MLLNPVSVHSPKTTQEAAKLYSSLSDVKLMAGGTFLLNSLKLLKRKGNKTASHIINLKKIEELQGVSLKQEVLTIRAMTTINELFNCPLLKDNLRVLRTVCRNISTNPIRNMATVGGNLTCRYTWTEMGAVMIALNATMHFIGADGTVHAQSAEEFFKGAAKTDKIFSHLSIKQDPSSRLSYQRVKKTMHVDVPLLAVCVSARIVKGNFENVCVSINNGITFAQRDSMVEEYLNHKTASIQTITQSLDHLNTEIYDKRSDEYKSHMFRVSIKNALNEIIQNDS